jgi:CRISPR/Cas system-associated endoribonuclease Cas2
MVVFIISYDLRKPDYDYQPLYDALDEIEAKHIQDSIWAVRTDSSAIQIFDYLWRYMHNEKDRLFVVPFDKAKSYKAKNSIDPLKSV